MVLHLYGAGGLVPMPKSNFEIETFSVGVVSNPSDERDIPKNAATYSLNLDPLDASELSGIPSDYFLKPGGFNSSYWGFTYHAGDSSTPGSNETPLGTSATFAQIGDTVEDESSE